MAYPEYAGGEQTLVTVGDISVTPSWVITPSGSAPVGLLFLLAKEDRTAGHVQITVQGPGLLHTVSVPERA